MPKKLQIQTAIKEKLRKTLPYGKVAHKMLVKWTTGFNFSNNLQLFGMKML